jgi:CPA2 family monovalent cation:H+ antiporter-2
LPHHTPLIGTIVAGLVIAFALGALAHRLKLPPIAGYLLAGVVVGPFTPGFVADSGLAAELAEIGVILLMFGVGLHFSLRDLMSVRRIAVPGALVQIGAATLMGMGLGWAMGWPIAGGIVFGLCLSVASTVVLLRALQARNMIETERGRIAVGWLIVEDLAMVLALVLLPALAGAGGSDWMTLAASLGGILLKVAGFVALMLIVGRRLIPWLLHWVAHSGSRELFRLAVLALALGVAFGAALAFQVSFALGAFFAGMILGETQLSRRAAEETLPLRDAFAVLFFVSVGMLFDPKVIVEQPGPLLATVAIIVFGKSAAAWFIVRAFGHPTRTALAVSASLAQIGEFSFILSGLGAGLGLLPPEGRDLILAGAILSILVNPFLFRLVAGRDGGDSAAKEAEAPPRLPGHIVLVGYGRVGKLIAAGLAARGRAFTVIEDDGDVAGEAAADEREVVRGNAAEEKVLRRAELPRAAKLLIAIPEGYEAGAIAEKARALVPNLPVIARAHSDAEVAYLEGLGVRHVVMGERVTAERMLALAAPGKAKGEKNVST